LRGDEPVELAALADGSLDSGSGAALEARVAASPGLAALLAEQERALALLHGAAATASAPAGLRVRIEGASEAPRRRRRPRFVLGTGLTAAAAVALVVMLIQPGGAAGPSVAAAAALATRLPMGPAPGPQPGEPKLLARAVGGVRFPNWQARFGWQATGVRTDTLGRRATITIFYRKGGHRLGYTIVGGAPLPARGGTVRVARGGVELRSFTSEGRLVVSWLRGGRTCVLSGRDVDRDVLLKLAAWKGGGAVPF